MFDSVESNSTPSASNITSSIMLYEYCAGPPRIAPDGRAQKRESARGAPAFGPLDSSGMRRRRTARNRNDLARGEMIPAMRTDHVRRGLRAADAMYKRHRRTRFVTEPRVAPSHHCDQHGVELESFAGQPILDPAAVALTARTIEDSVAHQVAQPRAQDVARDSGPLLKLVEAMASEKRLAQYQHCPALADYRQRARHRAIHLFDRIPSHGRLSLSSPELNFTCRDVPQRPGSTKISLHFETWFARKR